MSNNQGVALFDRDKIVELQAKCSEPVKIWQFPVKGREYILSADPGIDIPGSPDNSAIEVIDIETGEQCAELSARIGPMALIDPILTLAHLYNDALVVVEANGIGIAVIDLLRHEERYENLYCWKFFDNARQQKHWGWTTTQRSRGQMIALFQAFFSATPERIRSPEMLHELDWVITEPNPTDDRARAMMIAIAVRDECLNKPKPDGTK